MTAPVQIAPDGKFYGQVSTFGTRGATLAVVMHYTAGAPGVPTGANGDTAESRVQAAIYTLNTRDDRGTNPGPDELGYHYIIAKNGTIYQLADADAVVQHTGRKYNSSTISVAIEAALDTDIVQIQANIAVGLVKSLLRKYNLNTGDVIGHSKPGSSETKVGNLIRRFLNNNKELPETPGLRERIENSPTVTSSGEYVRSRWYTLNPNRAQPTNSTSTPSTSTSSTNTLEAYFKITYIDALARSGETATRTLEAFKNKEITTKYDAPLRSSQEAVPFQEALVDITVYDQKQLEGELTLLQGVNEAQSKAEANAIGVLNRSEGLLPSEIAFIVLNDLVELYPDIMRNKMLANSNDSSDYAHAWRAPGKLAITANITIPGASGFRIGQVFWLGRTYAHYKYLGAFQLFGLTETITVDRGWTTQLYARFNAIPESKLSGLTGE